MINAIRNHITMVLAKSSIDKEYEEDLISACIDEYNRGLAKGLKNEEAYRLAIKDFDEEFNQELIASLKVAKEDSKEASDINKTRSFKKRRVHNNMRIIKLSGQINILLSALLVLIYVSCVYFLGVQEFKWSGWVFFVPNISFLLIKLLIMGFFVEGSIKTEIKTLLVGAIFYIPIALIGIMGLECNLLEYIIYIPLVVMLIGIPYIAKHKKALLYYLIFSMIAVLLYLGAYFNIFQKAGTTSLILLFIYLGIIGLALIEIIKHKASLKDYIGSLILVGVFVILFVSLIGTLSITYLCMIASLGMIMYFIVVGLLRKRLSLVPYMKSAGCLIAITGITIEAILLIMFMVKSGFGKMTIGVDLLNASIITTMLMLEAYSYYRE